MGVKTIRKKPVVDPRRAELAAIRKMAGEIKREDMTMEQTDRLDALCKRIGDLEDALRAEAAKREEAKLRMLEEAVGKAEKKV
jgi:hypothetical protein